MASSRDKSEVSGGSSTLTLTAPPPPRPHLPIGGAPLRSPGPLSARPPGPPGLSNGSAAQSGPRSSPLPMSGPSFSKPPPGAPAAGSYAGPPSDSNSADSDKSLKMKIKRTKSGQLKTEDFKGSQTGHTNGDSESASSRPSSPLDNMNGISGKLSMVTTANTVSTPRGVKVSLVFFNVLPTVPTVDHKSHHRLLQPRAICRSESFGKFTNRFSFWKTRKSKESLWISGYLSVSLSIPSQI